MTTPPRTVLGIETSCDETAAAVVQDVPDPAQRVRAEVVLSQIADHAPFAGVVPEVAARAHLSHLSGVITETLTRANCTFSQLDGIAVTGGPGLIGGVIVGVMTAKAIASVHDLPFVAVNHLEGHALSVRLSQEVPFPYLLLLVSGGHCQLQVVEGVGHYHRLGATIDDALGEAYDKVAKMLGLGYPGGPAVERVAENGDSQRYSLPRPMTGKPGCHFSFSGLKTAVRQTIESMPPGPLTPQQVADLCASFQAAAAATVVERCRRGIEHFLARHPQGTTLVAAGGVAANRTLRGALETLAGECQLQLVCPPLNHCTDNGAMIAWAGIERLRAGYRDRLDFAPRPRWPLDPTAPAAAFAGGKA